MARSPRIVTESSHVPRGIGAWVKMGCDHRSIRDRSTGRRHHGGVDDRRRVFVDHASRVVRGQGEGVDPLDPQRRRGDDQPGRGRSQSATPLPRAAGLLDRGLRHALRRRAHARHELAALVDRGLAGDVDLGGDAGPEDPRAARSHVPRDPGPYPHPADRGRRADHGGQLLFERGLRVCDRHASTSARSPRGGSPSASRSASRCWSSRDGGGGGSPSRCRSWSRC